MHEMIFGGWKRIWKGGNVRVGMEINMDKMTSLGEDQEPKESKAFGDTEIRSRQLSQGYTQGRDRSAIAKSENLKCVFTKPATVRTRRGSC